MKTRVPVLSATREEIGIEIKVDVSLFVGEMNRQSNRCT